MVPSKLTERIRNTLLPSGNVIELAVTGGLWVGVTNVLNRVIQLTKIIILANLLPPVEFGLLGIGFLTLGVFRSFSQFGVGAKLVQLPDENVDHYLNTAFSIGIVRGVVLSGAMFVVAPYAALFFGEPRAADVIRVLGLMPLLLGFANPGVVYFQKDLLFHKQSVYVLSGTVVNFVVAVVAGVLLENVWALVFGSIAGNVVTLVASYLLHSYRPRPALDRELALEFIDYGKWIFGSGILGFLIAQGDDAFVGWFLGATALGFYQMAYRFSNAPATEVTEVLSRVVFPSYSKVQDDRAKLLRGFYRTLRFSTFISFPLAVGIIALAPLFVSGFLGQQWTPVIPALQVLAVWGFFKTLPATVHPLFRATDRPDLETKIKIGTLVIIALLIYPATSRYGIVGTGGAIAFSSIIFHLPVSLYLAVNIVGGSTREVLKILAYPTIGSVLMGAVLWRLQTGVSTGIPAVDFLLLTVFGIVVYLGYIRIVVGFLGYEIGDEFRTIRRTLGDV